MQNFPDPKSKVERLRLLKGCLKCTKLNHEDSGCKFHFHKRRDSGCQASFITAQRVDLPVLKKDFQLKVHGFNTSQVYHTKAYKANLAIGEQVHEIEVIGVPSIKTCMTLPGLSTLVHGFKGKGYHLSPFLLIILAYSMSNLITLRLKFGYYA